MHTKTIYATDLQPDDYVQVWGRSGFSRVARGYHRDVFSMTADYFFITLSDGTEILWKLIDKAVIIDFDAIEPVGPNGPCSTPTPEPVAAPAPVGALLDLVDATGQPALF